MPDSENSNPGGKILELRRYLQDAKQELKQEIQKVEAKVDGIHELHRALNDMNENMRALPTISQTLIEIQAAVTGKVIPTKVMVLVVLLIAACFGINTGLENFIKGHLP